MKISILLFAFLAACTPTVIQTLEASDARESMPHRNQPTDSTTTTPSTIRAVSLKVLQTVLRDCLPNGSCPRDVLELGNLTIITGYVVDEANDDLILFGEAGDGPALLVEDLALERNGAEDVIKSALSIGGN